jgi:hypothetical protein
MDFAFAQSILQRFQIKNTSPGQFFSLPEDGQG